MFKPHVIPYTKNHEQFCVRKLTIFGWKYLDLHNYKHWHKPSKSERQARVLGVTWLRCCGSKQRAQMALTFNQNPPPF